MLVFSVAGLLSFSYASGTGTFEIVYVRITQTGWIGEQN